MSTTAPTPLPSDVLPPGIRSRFVPGINGLTMHVLEAGFETAGPALRPAAARLPGARLQLAQGDAAARRRRLPRDRARPARLRPHHRLGRRLRRRPRLVPHAQPGPRRARAGRRRSAIARWRRWSATTSARPSRRGARSCGPDVFRSVVLMSAPFAGPPALPFDTAAMPGAPRRRGRASTTSSPRSPRPRKHYQWYYSTREANDNMWHCPQGVHAFLRAYYHHKSADWKQNTAATRCSRGPPPSWRSCPTYYVMDLDQGMAETVAPEMPSAAEIAACQWLPDDELRVYSDGVSAAPASRAACSGIAAHRRQVHRRAAALLRPHHRRAVDASSPARATGASTRRPATSSSMQNTACTRMLGCHLVDGAGHWVQQEQPEAVSRLLVRFLQAHASAR